MNPRWLPMAVAVVCVMLAVALAVDGRVIGALIDGALAGFWFTWALLIWATAGTVGRRDLPEARVRALRKPLPLFWASPAVVKEIQETLELDTLPGGRNGAVTGYFAEKHDAAEMERLLDERCGLGEYAPKSVRSVSRAYDGAQAPSQRREGTIEMGGHASARELHELHEDERARWRAAAQARDSTRRDLESERERARRRELSCMHRENDLEDPDFPGCVF